MLSTDKASLALLPLASKSSRFAGTTQRSLAVVHDADVLQTIHLAVRTRDVDDCSVWRRVIRHSIVCTCMLDQMRVCVCVCVRAHTGM